MPSDGPRPGRFLRLSLAVSLIGAAGCLFDPKVPDAKIICNDDSDCQLGWRCVSIPNRTPELRACCRLETCSGSTHPPARGDAGKRDGASYDDGKRDGGSHDSEDAQN